MMIMLVMPEQDPALRLTNVMIIRTMCDHDKKSGCDDHINDDLQILISMKIPSL